MDTSSAHPDLGHTLAQQITQLIKEAQDLLLRREVPASNRQRLQVEFLETGPHRRHNLGLKIEAIRSGILDLSKRIRVARKLPILMDNLPDEILLMMLMKCIEAEKRPYSTLIHLSGICRRWRTLLINCAQGWTNITIGRNHLSASQDRAFTSICLERSKNAPLCVRLVQPRFRGLAYDGLRNGQFHFQVETSVLQSILSNTARLLELTVHMPLKPLREWARLYAEAPATRLEVLRLKLCSREEDSWTESQAMTACIQSTPIFADNFGSLRSLSLHGFHVPWCSNIYTGLKYLFMEFPVAFRDWGGFTSVLEQSPGLEWLGLEFGHRMRPSSDSEDARLANLPPASLASLAHFHLHGFTIPEMTVILDKLSFPETASLDINALVWRDEDVSFVRIIEGLPMSVQTSLRLQTLARVTFLSPQRIPMISCPSRPGHRLVQLAMSNFCEFTSVDPTVAFKSILGVFPLLQELTLHGSFHHMFTSQLADLRSLTTLHVEQDSNVALLKQLRIGHPLETVRTLGLHNIRYPSLVTTGQLIYILEHSRVKYLTIVNCLDLAPEQFGVLADRLDIEVRGAVGM